MHQTVRACVYETNSSSTHSLIMVDTETFGKFKEGLLVLNFDNEEFIPIEDVASLYSFKEDFPYYEGASDEDKKDMIKKYVEDQSNSDYATIGTFRSMDLCTKDCYDKDGKEQVAFSYYVYR